MKAKEKKRRRESSHNAKFVVIPSVVFLSVLLFIGIAKFASLKTLFWLE